MSFQFNFTLETADESGGSLARSDMQKKSADDDCACVEVGRIPASRPVATEIALNWDSCNYQVSPSATYRLSDGTVLECVLPADCEKNEVDSALYQNVALHTDLLPNVYEGGFKVWECCVDLIQFLAQQKFVFQDKIVLELGCGAGLPGIYALLHGSVVHFQDYNEDVLHRVTVPSIIASMLAQHLSWPPRCRFFHGDWDGLTNAITSTAKYDFILASETVYSLASYHKFHSVMEALLKQDGEIYIAAKTCYFGVGGGSQDFATYVRHHNIFNVEVVHSVTTGVKREILKLTFKDTRDVMR